MTQLHHSSLLASICRQLLKVKYWKVTTLSSQQSLQPIPYLMYIRQTDAYMHYKKAFSGIIHSTYTIHYLISLLASLLPAGVTTNLGDHCWLVPASELLKLAHLQSSLDDWPQCLLGIQPMLASVITILLNVHPTSKPCVKMSQVNIAAHRCIDKAAHTCVKHMSLICQYQPTC